MKLEIGKPPPEIQWVSVSGDTLSWGDLAQGRALVMVFWTTWCKGCKKEWPKLKELAGRYSASPKAPTWASVSLGEPGERVARVARERGLPGKVLADPKEERGKILGINYVPSVLVVDPDGQTVYAGPSNVKKLEKLLAAYSDPTDPKKEPSP